MNKREAKAECSKRWCLADDRFPMALRRKRSPLFVIGYHVVEDRRIVMSQILGTSDAGWEQALGAAIAAVTPEPVRVEVDGQPVTKTLHKILTDLSTRTNPVTIKQIVDRVWPGDRDAWSCTGRVLREVALPQGLVVQVNLMQWKISDVGREALQHKEQP